MVHLKILHSFSVKIFISGHGHSRVPRFLRRKVRGVFKKMNKGKNIIMQAYFKQFLKNWKINYEFIYKAYFMKIAALMKSSET